MPRKILKLSVNEEQLAKLEKALKIGTPLNLALQYAGIARTSYYYWVAMYSVVSEIKSQDELEDLKANKFGVSIDEIKEIAAENASKRKTALDAFIEPSAESLLKYRNDSQFRAFADKCYEIICKCNGYRAEAAVGHLGTIVKSTSDKRVNASGSMWFLERTFSEFFSKPSEKAKEEETEVKPIVDKIKIELVDPNGGENKDRVKNMEELILKEQKGIGQS